MLTSEFGKEPIDYKLVGLRLIRKLWLIPIALVVGVAVVSSCYYYAKIIAKGGRTYQAESIFYVDYSNKPNGEQYDYYNYYTWGEVIHTDFFMDGVLEKLQGEMERSLLGEYISATVESDPRYLYVRSKTHDAELSLRIAKILEEVVPTFQDTKKEIQSISLEKTASNAVDISRFWIESALLFGPVFGVTIAIFGILLYLISDSSVYLPSTLEKRYAIPCLGTQCMKEYPVNCEHYLRESQQIALVPVEELSMGEIVFEHIAITGDPKFVICKNPIEYPEELGKLKQCDKVVLEVKAATRNSKQIERLLEQLQRLDIPVTAMVLVQADAKLLKSYYRRKA